MFKLHTNYQPMGDQPQAIEKLTNNLKNGVKYQTLLGATGTGKTFTIANVIKNINKNTLVLAHNKTLAGQLYSELKTLFPENRVEYFISYYDYYQPEAYVASKDLYIEKDSSINDDIDQMRHSAVSSLLTEDNVIVVSSVSCIYGIGDPEDYENNMFVIRQNDTYTRHYLLERLIKMQYERNDYELKRGTFRIKGDIIDIVPTGEKDEAIRLEFFDDEIDCIKIIDTLTGRVIGTKKLVTLYPATLFSVSDDKMKLAIARIKEELKERIEYFKSENKLLEAQRIEQRIGRCHRYGQKNDVVVVNFLNKNNAADIRVYELLQQKFSLFDGVFGASDEILGATASGIDFERRVVEILRTRRTEEEISEEFDILQKELEYEINEKMSDTRKKLLENFDIEVARKLKTSQDDTFILLSNFEQELWDLTTHTLKNFASFDNDTKTFELKNLPNDFKDISLGRYNLSKNSDNAYSYRIGHPLAVQIIEKNKDLNLPIKEITFNYTDNKNNIAALKDYVGESGWLLAKKITVSSFDTEESIMLAAYTDSGEVLDEELCKKLFILNATENEISDTYDQESMDFVLDEIRKKALKKIENRNSDFINEQMDKINKWADDRKNSLKVSLNLIEEEIARTATRPRLIERINDGFYPSELDNGVIKGKIEDILTLHSGSEQFLYQLAHHRGLAYTASSVYQKCSLTFACLFPFKHFVI